MEKQILEALEEIKGTLQSHGKMLKSHSEMLQSQGKTLKSHSEMLQSQGETLKSHSEMLKSHSEMFKEHGLILAALRTNQEETNAKIDEMKLQNAKDFGEMKERMQNVEVSIDVLKDETWSNKKDIYRIKNTMGLN